MRMHIVEIREPSSAPFSLMRRLKEQTARAHRLTEEAARWTAEGAELEAYVRYLVRLYGFLEPLEQRLESVLGNETSVVDLRGRGKRGWLERDLRHFAIDPSDLPRWSGTAQLAASTDRGLGCAYVLEGSTLGGRLLARQVQRRWGLGPESGAAFLAGYGDAVGARWREFGARVDRHGQETPAAAHDVVLGAGETFSALTLWLRGGDA